MNLSVDCEWEFKTPLFLYEEIKDFKEMILMKIPVFIVNSMQFQNQCQYVGTNGKKNCVEALHTRVIAEDIYNILKADERLSVGICPVVKGKSQAEVLDKVQAEVIKFAKSQKQKIYAFSTHTNAGGGDGSVVFFNSKDPVAKKMADIMNYELINVTKPWKTDGARAYDAAHEMRTTLDYAHYILMEPLFHDSAAQAKYIHENSHLITLGILKGIYRCIGLTYSEELNVEIIKYAKILSDKVKWLAYLKSDDTYVKTLELVALANNVYKYKTGKSINMADGVSKEDIKILADFWIGSQIATQRAYWEEAFNGDREVPSSVLNIEFEKIAKLIV